MKLSKYFECLYYSRIQRKEKNINRLKTVYLYAWLKLINKLHYG